MEAFLKKINTDFIFKKLEILDRHPVVLRHNSKYMIDFGGRILEKISQKNFDIVFCKNEDDVNNILKKYEKGEIFKLEVLKKKKFLLSSLKDFQRTKRVWEEGEYSLMGDILIVFPFNLKNPIRISMFDSVVESIEVVEKNSFRKLNSLEYFSFSFEKDIFSFSGSSKEKYKFPLIVVDDRFLKIDFGFESLDLGFRNIPGLDYYVNNRVVVSRMVDEYIKKGFDVFCSSKNLKGIKEIFKDREFFLIDETLEKGLVNSSLKILILTDYELFGKVNLGDENDWLKQVIPGDFLVHEDHGIGVFEGIVKKNEDIYIDIRYAGKDVLLVPLTQSEKVNKYIGGRGRVPTLTTLNGGSWKRIKKRVKVDAEKLAKDLLQLYAMRSVFKFDISLKKLKLKDDLNSFIGDFEFKDTVDQNIVSNEIFEDMTGDRLMDRLLVGDVGFGKTEVAMRGAFLALSMGMQVVVLAPTTILVSQHSFVFKERFKKYNFNISTISRLTDLKEKEEIVNDLQEGKINLIIGTHSLLNDRIKFKNLGLVIIDEEQKFGVKQKEKLRQKRIESHVLSMSATPIPRSMSMSLSGIRDISMLFTPPEGRKSIENRLGAFDWGLVKEVIAKEIERGGQVYFLHNRVVDIHFVEKKLVDLFPDLNIGILHGQLGSKNIGRVMDAFCNKKIDVLICTTIIENGIDLPNVNTLIVDDASRFGLSQLYQIRGRIGRSSAQAYAYFLYKSMSSEANLRLDALMEAQDLGSGFLLANRDLEIRGAGDLLGSSQSGNINSVGYGLFMKFLQEAVEDLKFN